MVSLLLIASVGGCSFALSQPDPLRAAHVVPRCDTGKGLVALDWVIAGVMATVALSALSEDAGELAAVSALTSAAFVASGVRGNGVVNKCRSEFAAYSEAAAGPDEVARRPRTFEDPYETPSDLPARRIVTPPPAPAGAPQTAPVPAKPTSTSAPAPAPAAAADEWSDFWTEVP